MTPDQMTPDATPAEPATSGAPTRRRRRSHPAFLALAATCVSATAVLTGASVSASTMPEAQPSSVDVITLGTFDGTDGYECNFTGDEAKALESQILSVDGTERVQTTVPLPIGDGVEAPTAIAGDGGNVTITGAVPTEGATTSTGGVAPVPAGEPIEVTAIPAGGAEGPAATGPTIRAGTDAECAALVASATDATR